MKVFYISTASLELANQISSSKIISRSDLKIKMTDFRDNITTSQEKDLEDDYVYTVLVKNYIVKYTDKNKGLHIRSIKD